MDGSGLVASLAGSADDDTRRRLKDLHSRHYTELSPLLRVLPGGREILDHVASMGLRVVLATSASQDELSGLRAVLDRDSLVAAVTWAADVDPAKPDPGIIKVGLDRAGLPIIGLLSGGISREELTTAGAAMVFGDPQDVIEHIDDTPTARLK